MLASRKPADAALSPAEAEALRKYLCSPGGQWPVGYNGPKPEAPKEPPLRQTKEEKLAMRAARREGQAKEFARSCAAEEAGATNTEPRF